MALIESPAWTMTTPGVVWVTGEQDIANVRELSARFAEAAAQGAVDLVVDLSGVEFMDASTVAAIVGLRSLRAAQSAPFSVRAPSARARRVLAACGLLELLDGSSEAPPQQPAALPLVSSARAANG